MKVKRIFLTLLSLGAVACALAGLSACNKTEKSQNLGITEQTAYAQAAQYGFTGTEEEFAAKLSSKVNAENGVYIQKVELTDDGELIITYTDGRVESLGFVQCVHAYSEWELSLEPTCSSIGYNTRTCSKCGDIDYDFIQPLGHTANEFTQVNQSSHTYYCANCGAYVHELHDLQDGECTVCDYVLDYTLGLTYRFVENTQSYRIMGADRAVKNESQVILPSIYNDYPVTIIGDHAFEKFEALEKVIIPESVTHIGTFAFMNSGIKEIIIPNSVEKFGHMVFRGCAKLEKVELSSNLKELGVGAFFGCSSLKSIVIPDSIEELKTMTFANCTGLKTVQLPEGLKLIAHRAFEDCTSLESLVIPEGITSIGGLTFKNCTSLTSLSLPEGITSIGTYAFENCAIRQLEIPASVEKIYTNAFEGSSLEKIQLPNGLKVVDSAVFKDCKSLVEVILPDSVQAIKINAFEGCSSLTKINIPKGIQKIGAGLFKGCTALQMIALPESVTSIEAGAFVGCDGLTTITYGGTKAQWKAISKESGWRAEDNIIKDLFVECSDGTLEYIW